MSAAAAGCAPPHTAPPRPGQRGVVWPNVMNVKIMWIDDSKHAGRSFVAIPTHAPLLQMKGATAARGPLALLVVRVVVVVIVCAPRTHNAEIVTMWVGAASRKFPGPSGLHVSSCIHFMFVLVARSCVCMTACRRRACVQCWMLDVRTRFVHAVISLR